jgi:hypothetical protein
MHADAEVDMSAQVVSVRSVAPLKTALRIPLDGDLAHSMPCATYKILAQPALRRFT